ncbi:MAG TPA: DUF190 domain-containing protein [Gaiellaceae bacterium]|nr:DUF190 domain-containing protein [Gaiellaceae bacterium]
MRSDVPGGKMLRIYIGEDDTWRGRPLYQQIVERARKEHLAGVTVMHGICGFGASSRIHNARNRRIREDIPIVIEIADTEERLRAFVPSSTGCSPPG